MNINIKLDVTAGTARRLGIISATLAVLGVAAAAYAAQHTFQANETLTAANLAGNFKDLDDRMKALEGASRIVSAFINGSDLTIARQNGSWVDTVSRAGTGDYTVSFAAGTFSGPPTCTASAESYVVSLHPPSAWTKNTVKLLTYKAELAGEVGAMADTGFMLTCVGPK